MGIIAHLPILKLSWMIGTRCPRPVVQCPQGLAEVVSVSIGGVVMHPGGGVVMFSGGGVVMSSGGVWLCVQKGYVSGGVYVW